MRIAQLVAVLDVTHTPMPKKKSGSKAALSENNLIE
jgi:hypothetical protein